MTPSAESDDQTRLRKTIDVAVRIGLVALLLLWAIQIVVPFVHLVAWAGIIAIALHPAFLKLRAKLGGSDRRASVLMTVALIGLVIVPTVRFAASSAERTREFAFQLQAGTLEVPPPGERVASLPVVGEELHAIWSDAAENLQGTLETFQEPIQEAGRKLLAMVASAGGTILTFTLSLVIAGIFLGSADEVSGFLVTLTRRLMGSEAGDQYVALATATVRSVAQGVIGIALIQSAAAGLGMVVVGIPLAGIWALAVLVLAIIQLPPLLVLAPVAAYGFSIASTLPATVFAVYCVVVSLSDTFLKPLLLGRGVDVPMLVILIGAIGGMIMSGIIGLFVGSVVLGLVYRLFVAWLYDDATTEEDPAAEPAPA